MIHAALPHSKTCHARKGAINCAPPFVLWLVFSPLAFAFNLEGKVELKPPHPAPVLLQIDEQHQAACGKEKVSSKLQVSPEDGIANAVVKLEGEFAPSIGRAPGQFTLDQKNCDFSPHVLLLPAGAEVSILNSDQMLHNVRAFDEKTEMLFNVAMPKKGQVLKKRFKVPGRYIFRCGVHPWMHALVIVQEHPYYALTDASGHFKIEGIPEGHYPIHNVSFRGSGLPPQRGYTLSVWHETLGELKREINPEVRSVELTYPAKTA